jgi:hypothetical protein
VLTLVCELSFAGWFVAVGWQLFRMRGRGSGQEIRQCSRHRAPGEKSRIGDEDENPGYMAPPPSLLALERLPSAYVGSPPVSLSIHRMHVCPKSAPSPYIIGQAPAITLMSC